MGKLIMPKQTSEVSKFIYTLDILYRAHQSGQPIVSNHDYKQAIIKKVSLFSQNSDSAMLVKQSELVRYFGFALGNFKKRNIQITPEGIDFYNAYLSSDKDKQFDLLVNSINTLSFGRNNTAIESSDADIDPPKLFIKSITALNGITNSELKSLLSLTNDFELTFESSIYQITESRRNYKDIIIPTKNINKYKDSKFPPFLVEIGFCYLDNDKRYQISPSVLNTYLQIFDDMSIYNKYPDTLKDLVFNDYKESDEDKDETVSESYKQRVANTLGYDIKSAVFKEQNTRIPIKSCKNKTSEKFDTNPRIGKTALELAEYKCENDLQHQTFFNKAMVPFMEPHHLVPMTAQKDFVNNLDCIENIVSLCPNCHSAIHYGCEIARRKILLKAYNKRIDKLTKKGLYISFDELFEKYYK